MEEMEEDEMDEMDNVKSGETGAMNGVVSTRAAGKVSFFLQTWRPAPVCVHLQVDPLWIVILPVSQIQHVTWLTQDGIEIASQAYAHCIRLANPGIQQLLPTWVTHEQATDSMAD